MFPERALGTAPTSWSRRGPVGLSAGSLDALVRNELPCIIVPDFATHAECAAIVASAQRIGFQPYEQVLPQIDRIGVTAFEYDRGAREMAKYFADAVGAKAEQRRIFEAAGLDPIARFQEAIRSRAGYEIDVMRDPKHGAYHAGLVRRIEQGTLLHVDFSPFEQPTWHVATIEAQLAWNLYIEVTDTDPGRTHIWNRPIVAADAALKVPGTYGFETKVVEGAEKITYSPRLGDLFLFNTRNFHQVEPTRARRTTCTSQIGVVGARKLAIWS